VLVMSPHSAPHLPIHVQDRLQLRTPDGRTINTYVRELGSARYQEPPRRITLIMGEGVAKQDVPAGTEVWHETEDL